jgi:hypothetical protein
VTALSHEFTELVAECLGFEPQVLNRYFDEESRAGGRLKVGGRRKRMASLKVSEERRGKGDTGMDSLSVTV